MHVSVCVWLYTHYTVTAGGAFAKTLHPKGPQTQTGEQAAFTCSPPSIRKIEGGEQAVEDYPLYGPWNINH